MSEKTIEAGNKPALYFNLKNIEESLHRYTYVIRYNSTEGGTKNETSSINISPGKTFRYSLILERPSKSTIVLSLKIFDGGEENSEKILYDQTWFVRP